MQIHYMFKYARSYAKGSIFIQGIQLSNIQIENILDQLYHEIADNNEFAKIDADYICAQVKR